ncbi:MAG: hypothetical protein ACLFPS_09015 [Clostridia bacterium]
MFYMAYAIGTTSADNEDITSDLKAATVLADVDNDQHPFAIMSLQLETTQKTGVSINGGDYIELKEVAIDTETTVYRYEIPKSALMRIKTVEIEDTGTSWSVVFQYQ